MPPCWRYALCTRSFVTADGTLYYRKSGLPQKVISSIGERNSILREAHIVSGSSEDAGEDDDRTQHVTSDTMRAIIEPRYKWHDVRLDIAAWVCQLRCYCPGCHFSAISGKLEMSANSAEVGEKAQSRGNCVVSEV